MSTIEGVHSPNTLSKESDSIFLPINILITKPIWINWSPPTLSTFDSTHLLNSSLIPFRILKYLFNSILFQTEDIHLPSDYILSSSSPSVPIITVIAAIVVMVLHTLLFHGHQYKLTVLQYDGRYKEKNIHGYN